MSIRLSHLAWLLALAIVASSIGGVAATWWIAEQEFRDVLEDDLEQQGELLAALVASDGFELTRADLKVLLADLFDDDEEESFWVTVYDLEGPSHISNREHEQPLSGRRSGALDLQHDGYAWHGYRAQEGDVVVQLMRRDDLYRELQEEIIEDIVSPALIGGGITLLLLAVIMIMTLWPLLQLARQVESRSPESLAPLAVRTPAREIAVLRDALNRLIGDVDATLARERQFASDVAHELRTPLATLALELGQDAPDVTTLRSEVRRLSRLVEQLLTLTRLEQRQWQGRLGTVQLAELAARSVARFEPLFEAAGMTLEAKLQPADVPGDPTLLGILLRNLLQNVLDHCGAGTHAVVAVERLAAGVRLVVSDDGAGIADGLMARMNEGFTRLDSKTEGLGLGLAICHRIAVVHGTGMRYSANAGDAGGLRVEAIFAS